MSPRAKKPAPKRGGARPGAGRPRTLEPPEDAPRIVVRLDEGSGVGLLTYHADYGATQSEAVRDLLTAYGERTREGEQFRNAVEWWRVAKGKTLSRPK